MIANTLVRPDPDVLADVVRRLCGDYGDAQ